MASAGHMSQSMSSKSSAKDLQPSAFTWEGGGEEGGGRREEEGGGGE